jgi:hypothetical protein
VGVFATRRFSIRSYRLDCEGAYGRAARRPRETSRSIAAIRSEAARLFQRSVAGSLIARSQCRLRPLDRRRSRIDLRPALGLLCGCWLALLLSLRILLRRCYRGARPLQRGMRPVLADALDASLGLRRCPPSGAGAAPPVVPGFGVPDS